MSQIYFTIATDTGYRSLDTGELKTLEILQLFEITSLLTATFYAIDME
jgi:hypothetical protein